ncbi:MAG TPA: hypothetical protein VN947_03845 [Polyangia bacterium]|nr:hypothetical protein [Polyangia bacterium]
MKVGGALVALAALVAVAGVAVAEGAQRFEGTLFSFSYPSSASTAPGTDPSADVAVTVTLKDGISASVIGGTKKIGEGAVDDEASAWHSARIKNRAAWGMKAGGGPPRDTVHIGERKWLRWRDHIGSMLGAQEQTMTCGSVSAHLVCVIVSAPKNERERGDALASQILSSLAVRKK